MSAFADEEIEYMSTQRLGRLATVDSDGDPHVVPVGFRYNPSTETIDIGGHDLGKTLKWKHARLHPRVAFVVDDVLPPWQPRSIEIQAQAELLEEGGQALGPGFGRQLMRLQPVHVISWGIIDQKHVSREISN